MSASTLSACVHPGCAISHTHNFMKSPIYLYYRVSTVSCPSILWTLPLSSPSILSRQHLDRTGCLDATTVLRTIQDFRVKMSVFAVQVGAGGQIMSRRAAAALKLPSPQPRSTPPDLSGKLGGAGEVAAGGAANRQINRKRTRIPACTNSPT